MATFGTPRAGPDDAAHALAAAFRIISGMERFNRESAERGAPALQVSAGLHFGPAIIGNIGPSRRLEFAVVGDTVNVASRLEAALRPNDTVARPGRFGGYRQLPNRSS